MHTKLERFFCSLPQEILAICHAINDTNGEIHLVGGAVRDLLFGFESKDLDFVVGGLTQEQLVAVLQQFGVVNAVGQSFGVIKLTVAGEELDFALRRTEKKSGNGYRGFKVTTSPEIDLDDDLFRRDLTVNALAICMKEQKLIDHVGGIEDFENKVLRHCSESFSEDPLRVLRTMQFASRFGMEVADETVKLSQELKSEKVHLSSERLGDEFVKWANKSRKASLGMKFLRNSDWYELFPALKSQSEAEWVEVCQAVDVLHDLCVKAHIKGVRRTALMLAALVVKTPTEIRKFTSELRLSSELTSAICKLVDGFCCELPATRPAARRLALRGVFVFDVLMLAKAFGKHTDKAEAIAKEARVLFSCPEPILQGKDLIAVGVKAGPEMGRLLEVAFELQLNEVYTTKKELLCFIKKAPQDS